MHITRVTVASLLLAAAAHATVGSYSPTAEADFPRNVYWGDTHLHTSVSADANVMGNTSLPPSAAYRFARGETVTAENGMKARLNRPLDFLVVADHAEYLGVLPTLREQGREEALSNFARQFFRSIMTGEGQPDAAGIDVDKTGRATWQRAVRAADAADRPGEFTAFAGFEWSAMVDGDNLHRVVMFRDGKEKTGEVLPFSALESTDPRDLWRYLANYGKKTGGTALAIPHNANVSNGKMFIETVGEKPMDADYAAERVRWEPLVEVTQIKGDGETHPLLSPNDEFADYGTWDKGNLGATALKEEWMLQYEYARSALRLGLRIAERTGVNPYRFGMIGSTDSHTSLATAEENNFWGKAVNYEPGSQQRVEGPFMTYRSGGIADVDTWVDYKPGESDVVVDSWEQVASGYAAVWATAKTREAIFDAMRRREVYATTGPRMTVRFFGGWAFEAGDAARSDYVRLGYREGVPMGSDIGDAPKNAQAPRFLVTAMKDPDGANLDRVQIVKGWLGEDGTTLHEKVYDVAWSGERKPDRRGRLPAVGNTVDLENASYRNSIGAAQLAATWQDPDFDRQQRAFYYVRVLEIPTPRWIVYDEKRLGSEFPTDAKRVHQERAYTSPIWYRPDSG